MLADLVRSSIEGVMDDDLMERAKKREAEHKIDLRKAAKFWTEELVPVLDRLELPEEDDE